MMIFVHILIISSLSFTSLALPFNTDDQIPVTTTEEPQFICPKYGFFPIEGDCKSYFQCDFKGSLGRRMQCGAKLLWNAKSRACDAEDVVDCSFHAEDVKNPPKKRLTPPFDVGRRSRDRIYEFRRFSVKPSLFKEFLGVIDQGCRRPDQREDGKRDKKLVPKIYDHGMTLVGAWIIDGGGRVNDVFTIWQIKGLRERFEARLGMSRGHAFKDSTNWRSNRLGSMVESEESVVLKLLDDWELTFPQSNGTYELQVTQLKPDSKWRRPFATATRVKQNALERFTGEALGIFFPLFGNLNRAYQLWQYKDLDERQEGLRSLAQSSAFVSASRALSPIEIEDKRFLLRPTKCSPMQ